MNEQSPQHLKAEVENLRAELCALKRKYRDFNEIGTDWHWELDRDLCYTRLEPSGDQRNVYPVEKFIGQPRESMKPECMSDADWQTHIDDLKAHRTVRGFIQPRPLADGSVMWLMVSAKPVFDESGEFSGYLGTASDISRLKRAEEELLEIQGSLEEEVDRRIEDLNESEDRYRTIFNNAAAGIGRTRISDGAVIFANRRLAEMFGYEDPQMFRANFKFSEHYPEDGDREGVLRGYEEHPDDVHELTFTRQDGSLIDIAAEIRPNFEDDYLDFVAIDISKQKAAERERHEYAVVVEAMIEHSPVTVSVKDREGKYLFVSLGYADLINSSVPDLIGRSSRTVLIPETATKLEEADRKVVETGVALGSDEAFPVSFGDATLLVTKFPIKDADGEVTAIGTVGIDVTKQIEVQKQLERARQEAEEASRAKSDFLASMSHELRTPLNSIIGFAEMMSNQVFGKLGDDRYEGYLNDIQHSGYLLLHLVNDVLDLSKIEAGQFELVDDVIDLDEVLRVSLEMISGRKEARSMTLHYKPEDRPIQIRADERAIKQVALNLLSNAVKYNNQHGEIVLALSGDEDNSISFSVSDTGIGIAAENISKILEPFGQVREDAHRAHEGTGLGLSLSKRLVELHGGRFELESEIGKGTIVTVRFPPERTI